MNLQEQIAEFEAKGCVAGGRKWELERTDIDLVLTTTIKELKIIVDFAQCEIMIQINDDHISEFKLKCTTIEEALIEALEIVKAKVIDLAKELGYVCFDSEGIGKLIEMDRLGCNMTEIFKSYQRLIQQYIEEQGNDSI